jgi:acyl carrier protein
MSSDLVSTIRTYILENFLFTDDASAIGLDDSLLENGIVDSTGMMEIITFLESDLDVKVADEDMTPENLDSINRLVSYVQRKRQATIS